MECWFCKWPISDNEVAMPILTPALREPGHAHVVCLFDDARHTKRIRERMGPQLGFTELIRTRRRQVDLNDL